MPMHQPDFDLGPDKFLNVLQASYLQSEWHGTLEPSQQIRIDYRVSSKSKALIPLSSLGIVSDANQSVACVAVSVAF